MQRTRTYASLLISLLTLAIITPILTEVALACPAYSEPIKHKQPDGKIVTIRQAGDEFFNYCTDINENPLLKDEKGFYRYVVTDQSGLKLGSIATDVGLRSKSTQIIAEEYSDFRNDYWDLEKLVEERVIDNTDSLSKKELDTKSLKQEVLSNEPIEEESAIDSSEGSAIYSELLDSDILTDESSSLYAESFEPSATDLETRALPSKIPLLILRITFNDVPSKSADATWSSRIFNSSTGVSAFYTETSNGKTTFTKALETQGTKNDGVVHVKLNEAYPNNGRLDDSKNYDGYRKAAIAIKKALHAANGTINYAQYDTNANGIIEGDELAIYVVFSGPNLSTSPNNTGIWAHRWNLRSAGAGAPTLDGVQLNDYAVSGEQLTANKLTSISTICHELGHVLGLPDLYNTNKSTKTYFDVNRLSLMSSSWGARQNIPGEPLPQHLDPWSKIKLGFYSPTLVSGTKNYTLYKSSDRATYSILKIPTQKASEYYLIENRQYTGFDAALYGNWSSSGGSPHSLHTDPSGNTTSGGIVIWRIDENIIRSHSAINGYGHTPGIMPIYVGNNKNVPFREPGKSGNLFNYSLNDYANVYATSLLDKQISVSSKATNGSITVGVKAGKAIPAKRLSGATRYETAVAVSKDGWKTSKHVILASGVNFPDGLAAAPLAKTLGAPILLANQTDTLPQATANEIKRLGATTVHIIGGTPAISAAVEKSLKTSGKTVKRYAGATRYETAQKIASALPAYSTIVVANSTDFPDSLSASAGAGYKGFPILYVSKDSIPAATQNIINKATVKTVIVIGSTSAISASVFNKIKASGKTVTRLQGATRYETNIAVQKYFFPSVSSIGFVATGVDFPDALAAGGAAARAGSPLLLTSNVLSGYPATTRQFIKDKSLKSLKLAGSTTVISNQILRHMQTVM